MEFFHDDPSSLGFRAIHPLLAEFLRNIPTLIDPSSLSEQAENRLYPEPSQDPELDQIRADWQAFVAPELQNHFQSARDIVAADLRRLHSADDQLFQLNIPSQHAEAWLNVLNQARLTLAANVGLDELATDETEPPDLLSESGVALFRINLYAFMQQCLVEILEE